MPQKDSSAIFIFDDEPSFALLIADQLERGGFTNVTSCSSARQALKVVANNHFDLAFLDVHTDTDPDAGLSLARLLERDGTSFIFATGRQDVNFKTMEDIYPAGILYKPYNKQNIVPMVERVLLDRKMASNSQCKQVIYIPNKGSYHYVQVADINYARADNGCCYILTMNDSFHTLARLTYIHEQLGYSDQFQKIDRAHLVNLEQIANFNKERVVFNNGKHILLSQQSHKRIRDGLKLLRTKKPKDRDSPE